MKVVKMSKRKMVPGSGAAHAIRKAAECATESTSDRRERVRAFVDATRKQFATSAVLAREKLPDIEQGTLAGPILRRVD